MLLRGGPLQNHCPSSFKKTLCLLLLLALLSVAQAFLRTPNLRSTSASAASLISSSRHHQGLKHTHTQRHTHTRLTMSTSASSDNRFNYSWQQTMLRIKDPKRSLPFYENVLGFHRLHEYKFDSFSLYFMYIPRPGEKKEDLPKCGTKESEKFLWTMKGTVLELTWNHGTETQADFQYNNGNVEPHRGFGHIAIACDDVYAACEKLEKQGAQFQKKPDEGRMKGLAFVKDPDGYWIEVISRDPKAPAFSLPSPPPYSFAQTMLRVKDPQKSLGFYQGLLGMKLLCVKHFADFSLYFLSHHLPTVKGDEEETTLPADPESEEAWGIMKRMADPVLELTHNHGTEKQADFSYHNGNTDPRGFGHIGFLVDNLEEACTHLQTHQVKFQKKPEDGSMRGLAFALDPDGYWVELVGRGLEI